MKRSNLAVSFIVVLAAASALSVTAQKVRDLPFGPGESLTYEAKVSKFISGMEVADLTMTVSGGSTPGGLQINADARSKGTLLALARYSFLYSFISNVDITAFRIEHTQRKTEEKERVRSGEAKFDYGEKRVTYVETDPKEPMRPPRKIASNIEDQTQDVVSGVYALRLLPLAVGKTFTITVSDTGLVYDVPVKVTGREVQKTILGKVWCFRVEPAVFGAGHMIEDKGSMSIWITDDPRRIPVRSRIDTSFGRVEVRLKAVTTSKLTAAK
jgi:hypothetical protein